jgi:hypothetical protein
MKGNSHSRLSYVYQLDIAVELGEGRCDFDLKISYNLHSSFCIVSAILKKDLTVDIPQI